MNRAAWSGILASLVVAATIGVTAQSSSPAQASPETPSPPTAQAPAPAPPQSSEERRITVAGCLQAASPSPVGTSGSAPAAPSAATGEAAKPEATSGEANIVLANAVPAPAATAAGASDSSAPQTYRLIANATALTPHLGKKLELSGTLEDSSAEKGPMLRVEAGKIIAEACTP
jgi:hypothetical protein